MRRHARSCMPRRVPPAPRPIPAHWVQPQRTQPQCTELPHGRLQLQHRQVQVVAEHMQHPRRQPAVVVAVHTPMWGAALGRGVAHGDAYGAGGVAGRGAGRRQRGRDEQVRIGQQQASGGDEHAGGPGVVCVDEHDAIQGLLYARRSLLHACQSPLNDC